MAEPAAVKPAADDKEKPAAATPPKLSLDECVRLALERQPGLRARDAGVAVAAAQADIARSYYFPQVGVTARFTQLDQHAFVVAPGLTGTNADLFADTAAFFGLARDPRFGPDGALAALRRPDLPPFSLARQQAAAGVPRVFQSDLLGERSLTADLLVTQPLYTGGKIRYRHEQAKLGVEAAANELVQTKQQLVFEVTRAYYGVVLARELARVADDAAETYKAVADLVKSLLDDFRGNVTTVDLQRTQALLRLAEGHKIQARRGAEQALAGLHAALGVDQAAGLDIGDERLVFRKETLDRAALLAEALVRRPEMAKVQLAVRAAELERKLADAAFKPDVAAFGRLSHTADNRDYPNPTNPTQFAVGVEASLPLAVGGRRLADRHKADAQLAQAVAVRDVVRNQIELEVEQARLEVEEAQERVPSVEKARDALRDALRLLRSDYFDLDEKDYGRHFDTRLSTRVLLSQTEAAYHQQVYAHLLALAKVRLATGVTP